MLTPDGHKYNPTDPTTIDQCWIQPTMYPNLVAYAADPAKAPYLNQFIIAACGAINQICRRKFNKQQIDQIFKDQGLFYREYRTFVMDNAPLVTVDNVWLEVVNTWAVVDLTFLQVMTAESEIKVLPTFSTYVQTTLPLWALTPSTNLWVRYTSGYAVDYSGSNTTNEVPELVRLATSMYVDYLFSRLDLVGGIGSYRTQTYSQTFVTPDKDPIYMSIDSLLCTYKLSRSIS